MRQPTQINSYNSENNNQLAQLQSTENQIAIQLSTIAEQVKKLEQNNKIISKCMQNASKNAAKAYERV
jgi:hypothetical protein